MADPIEVALWEQRVAETSERLAQSEEREAVLEQMQAELNAQSARVDELRAMLDAGGADMDAEQRARFETMCNEVSTLLIEEKMTSVFGIQTNEGVNHAALLSIDEISKILLHQRTRAPSWRRAQFAVSGARPPGRCCTIMARPASGTSCVAARPAARHFVNVASYFRLHWQLVEQRDMPMYWLQELRLEDLQFIITFTRYYGFPCGQQGGIKWLLQVVCNGAVGLPESYDIDGQPSAITTWEVPNILESLRWKDAAEGHQEADAWFAVEEAHTTPQRANATLPESKDVSSTVVNVIALHTPTQKICKLVEYSRLPPASHHPPLTADGDGRRPVSMRFEDQQLVLRPSPYGDDIMRRLGLGLMRPFVSVSIDEGPEAGDNWRLLIGVVGVQMRSWGSLATMITIATGARFGAGVPEACLQLDVMVHRRVDWAAVALRGDPIS